MPRQMHDRPLSTMHIKEKIHMHDAQELKKAMHVCTNLGMYPTNGCVSVIFNLS